MPYKDPEKRREYERENRASHRARCARYRGQHRTEINDRAKVQYCEHRDAILERQRELYQQNRDERIAKSAKYRKHHRDEINLRQRVSYSFNRDVRSAYRKLWPSATIEKERERHRTAYAKMGPIERHERNHEQNRIRYARFAKEYRLYLLANVPSFYEQLSIA